MAQKYTSFSSYLEDVYYNQIFDRIKFYIINNRDRMNLSTYSVPDPSYAELSDFHVMSVTFRELDNDQIEFRASIQAEIEISGKRRRDFESDTTDCWFSISFSAVLNNGLHQVKLLDISEYSKERFNAEDSLTKYLVPYVYAKDLDSHAEKFLLNYCPRALNEPIIVPEEAEIIKRIYREYLEGASMLKIKRGLEADGILNGAGNEKWHTSNINQILRNEKYIGDALLQKTYTTDFLTKTRVKNHGVVPQYYVENSHEAIIPREIFMQVQEELIQRRIVHTSPNGKNRTFSCIHCFSNMIVCGGCGEVFRRVHWNNRGKKSIVWRCVSRLENTGLFCEARTVLESSLEQVMVTAINQALCDKDHFLITLQKNIETVICHENSHTLTAIDKRLTELQAELLKLANSKADYEKVGNEIYRLREEKQKAQVENLGRDELQKRITDMSAFLQEQPTALTEYNEALVRRLIEKVIVYEDKFTVEFKSGITIDIES